VAVDLTVVMMMMMMMGMPIVMTIVKHRVARPVSRDGRRVPSF
jgi:hypothetical protein